MTGVTKLNSARRYLLESGTPHEWEAVEWLSALIRLDDIERIERNCFRRAARKAGRVAAEHATGFWQLPGNPPDQFDIWEAAKFAKVAASNAFAAHPELRAS